MTLAKLARLYLDAHPIRPTRREELETSIGTWLARLDQTATAPKVAVVRQLVESLAREPRGFRSKEDD